MDNPLTTIIIRYYCRVKPIAATLACHLSLGVCIPGSYGWFLRVVLTGSSSSHLSTAEKVLPVSVSISQCLSGTLPG